MATEKFRLRDIQLFDTRTVDRHIERGLTTRDEYDQYVESLEDCADLAVPSNVHFVYTGKAPEQEVIVTKEMIAAKAAEDARRREAAIKERAKQG